MQISKNLFTGIVLFIGTILILFGVNLIIPQNTADQDKSTYFTSQLASHHKTDVKQNSNTEAIQNLTKKQLEYMENGQYQEALQVINKIIEADPQIPDVYYERGTMHIATNNPLAAIADFQTAEDLYHANGDLGSADRMQRLIDETQKNFVNTDQ
ncbi:hypothetical protein [Nostoc sp. MG11]|uniref:hypothetical protein n=1 Tax=Nostoc sp. MG11 TaxID=2721166 RepID=UPI001866BF4C|nr:hypothetical protein [Nostoc sp. MG11]